MLKARPGQAEVVETVVERLARDRHGEIGHVGEIRQPHPSRLVNLPEDHLLLRAVDRAPGTDAPFDGAADTGIEIGVAPRHLLEDRHGAQARSHLQHRHDLGFEESSQRIRPTTFAWNGFLRRKPRILFEPIAGRCAEACLGRRNRHRLIVTISHE